MTWEQFIHFLGNILKIEHNPRRKSEVQKTNAERGAVSLGTFLGVKVGHVV